MNSTSPKNAATMQAEQTHRFELDADVARACARIAPTWPLDRFIAVNPFWGCIDTPISEVATTLQALSGAQLLMPRAWYRQAHNDGRLTDAHLQAAIALHRSPASVAALHELMKQEEPRPSKRPSVAELTDQPRQRMTRETRRGLTTEPSTEPEHFEQDDHRAQWRAFITHNNSQFCASYFDDGQAQISLSRGEGLYASWYRHAVRDAGPSIVMDAPWYRHAVSELPPVAGDLIEAATRALGVSAPEREHYFWSLLLDHNGWASWCAYRRWTALLAGTSDDALSDLLAIRLAWELMLYRHGGEQVARRWRAAKVTWAATDLATDTRDADWVLQSAMELSWQDPVARALTLGLQATRPTSPPVQAVFCIDVRSEVFRRALEAAAPSVQTLGFAGFFGLPLEYQPHGAPQARPQLPGLLSPRYRATDHGVPSAATDRAERLVVDAAWKGFARDAVSTFTFIEAVGVSSIFKLVKDGLGFGAPAAVWDAGLSSDARARRKPRLSETAAGEPVALEVRCDLAQSMLRGMSLTRDFARIVMLTGHGSVTRNNPHAAGLDCGACCGQTGEVNARVAASLLNEPDVRAGLAERGIAVPLTTVFVAALHNTTEDEIEFFDLDDLPTSHREDVNTLRAWLSDAGVRARAERAPLLGIAETDPLLVRRAMHERATDWAQVRPEWGLANNAAFIVAPREHCRHLNLEGRSFLHEYRHQEDTGFSVLESIMTAPMVVTHWINFQYYASTVDPVRYGSGDKVLHNVVGAHIGVFEGNGGDLRIGLPLQSLHNGQRWMHMPLRLSVFIEAPRKAIDAVLEKHAHVRALVQNGWLSLFQIDEAQGAVYRRHDETWLRHTSSSVVASASESRVERS